MRSLMPLAAALLLTAPSASADVLDQFRKPGQFTLSLGDASASFPVPNLTLHLERLKGCIAQFPDAEEQEAPAP